MGADRAVAARPDAEASCSAPDHREVIDAIAWRFQTGSQWVHLPGKYGKWQGVYNRLRMWVADCTWERVFTALMAQADADEDVCRVVSVDSTIVRAHQHAAGARKKGPWLASPGTHNSPNPCGPSHVTGRLRPPLLPKSLRQC
ncbi:transposase [Streptomyces sp. NBC_00555]|uniref:transposase n=1 Tax=Streptomyces sp. NBC_00555 TaxID=2903662 RepID=UPI003390703D